VANPTDTLARSRPVSVALDVQRRYGRDAGGHLAAALTHYGFLSMFPLILLGLAVVGFILAGDPAAQADWADRLSGTVPGLGPLIGRSIDDVVALRGPATLIGVAGLLWTGIGVVEGGAWAVGRVFRAANPSRGFVRDKLWALGTLGSLGVLALVAVALVGIVGSVEFPGPLGVLAQVGTAVAAFGLDLVLFLAAYRLLVRRGGPDFRRLWPGAALAASGWFLLKLAGTWYATRAVAGATAVYGTFAAVVGVFVLLNLAARVFVYGAELNAVLIERRTGPLGEATEGGGANVTDGSESSAMGNGKAGRPPAEQSTVELLRSIAGDTGTLVKKEVELARREITEAVTARLKAVAGLAAAGVLALLAVIFLGTAGAWGLSIVLPLWAAWLIVGGVFLLLALGALLFAKRRFKVPPMAPEETKRTVKEDVEWARAQLKR
jgi:YihY family inner membrane protein